MSQFLFKELPRQFHGDAISCPFLGLQNSSPLNSSKFPSVPIEAANALSSEPSQEYIEEIFTQLTFNDHRMWSDIRISSTE